MRWQIPQLSAGKQLVVFQAELKGAGMFAKKSLENRSCRRGTFWWPFPVFEILAYCSLYFRFPCRALFYSVPWNQNESVYISQTETNITKESHTTLEQISIMNLKRENASDQVEVRFGFTSNFCRGWCAISDYCWNPLDHCFI